MNTKLYNYLISKFEREATVERYKLFFTWVNTHFLRLCTDYAWIELGGYIKWDDRICKVEAIHINTGVCNSSILLDTGYGNIWYYEAKKPTKKELKEYLVESN